MLGKPAIRICELGKKYHIGSFQTVDSTLSERISASANRTFRRIRSLTGRSGQRENSSQIIWALKDISFEVAQGEVVGVIGHNGAGKSTLLKILSRITRPTTGYAEVRGRVGSLLEVGTGFHGELTGRENVYLSGAILGMKRAEIAKKFDEIVAFSGVETFIDTPVKHYSSGMYLRLAFAVAAHLEPENLFVDEVLAVGDAAFQKKCLGKMSEVANEGRTILFVSHNLVAVQSLCQRAIWINEGQIVEDGASHQVVSSYLKTTASTLTHREWDDISSAPGVNQIFLHKASVHPEEGTPADQITVSTPFVLEFEFWNRRPKSALTLSIIVFNEQGIIVFSSGTNNEGNWHGRIFPPGLFQSRCHIPGYLLNSGTYRVRLLFLENEGTRLFSYDDILTFDILDTIEGRSSWFGEWGGVIRPNLQWKTELINNIS